MPWELDVGSWDVRTACLYADNLSRSGQLATASPQRVDRAVRTTTYVAASYRVLAAADSRGVQLAYVARVEMETSAHRCFDIVMAHLVADADFRRRFLRDPHSALRELLGRARLTEAEIVALLETHSVRV